MFKRVLAVFAMLAAGGTLATVSSPSGESASRRGGARYTNTMRAYSVPDLTLINQDGREVSLVGALDSRKPVAMNFIFTTCTTICPVMSATFAQLHRELGSDARNLRLISISIDPEYDTPAKMKKYLGRFGSASGWEFLTGDARQIETVLQAFNALHGSKMNHRPLTFFHIPGHEQWLRIDGLASAADLASEYRDLAARGPIEDIR